MKKFSYYNSGKGIRQTAPTGTLTLQECAAIIKSDELKDRTINLRTLTDPKTKSEYKANNFPYVTFAGVFTSRANNKLVEQSPYFCIDLDHLGALPEIHKTANKICEYFTPAMMFVSPSGDGLKVIFETDIKAGEYKEYFMAFTYFFRNEIHVEVDKGTTDIARACFLCHDSEIFYSDSPSVVDGKFLSDSLPVINAANAANMDESKYKKLKVWADSKQAFIAGNRNNYIVELVGACNRMGINETFVMSQMNEFTQPDFTMEQITKTVRTIYYNNAYNNIAEIQQLENCPYIRVGCDYFKKINKQDTYGILRRELKRWTKDTLITDHKRCFLKGIPKYDDFVMVPDNINYQPIVNNCYNMYAPFCHIPEEGDWTWTKRLMEHIFGEQYDLGIRYMQLLYCYPKRATVILALVSAIQKTGKTTFVNWISMLFGSNTSVISSMDFQNAFNGHYATKNLVMIEETLFDKKISIEKLKALATGKQLSVNKKNIDQFNLDFFGKIILTSNFEDKFASISSEETRFFVRKLDLPKFQRITIEKDLLSEIPAFLFYLKNLPAPDECIDRSGFTSEELRNEFIDAVKIESRHETTKELEISLTDFFNENEDILEFEASCTDLKNKFFPYDNRTGRHWLIRILKKDLKMMPTEYLKKYIPFNESLMPKKAGRPYMFLRKDYTDGKIEEAPF